MDTSKGIILLKEKEKKENVNKTIKFCDQSMPFFTRNHSVSLAIPEILTKSLNKDEMLCTFPVNRKV